MITAVRLLHALSQVLSSIGLYGKGHPARQKSLDEVYNSLLELQDLDDKPTFTFFEDEVVYMDQPLRELRGWVLASKLAASGIERIEFESGVTPEELSDFMIELVEIISARKDLEDVDEDEYEYIRFGPVSLLEQSQEETLFALYEQAEMSGGLFEEAAKKGTVSRGLSRSVLDSIWGAVHSEDGLVIPIVSISEEKELVSVRSMNTSVLAIAFGRYMKLIESEIRMIGEAALLHNIGMVSVPLEIIHKPGKLNDEEWDIIMTHPVEGARILMKSGEHFAMAAVAAYEHHLSLDGMGYPEMLYPRTPHRISQVVRLCDVYDAMRTKRPYEGEQPLGRIMEVMKQGVGSKFSPELVENFTGMLRDWAPKFVVADAGSGGEISTSGPEEITLI